MKEGPLVQMLDRQRVQQAAADAAKKLVDAAALAAERLVDATKEAEETATVAAAEAALSAPEEAQVSLSGSTATAACCYLLFLQEQIKGIIIICVHVSVPKPEEPIFYDFGVQQVSCLLEIYGKDIERGGQRYPALLSDSTLAQYEVYKKLV
jgi:hypothetical protein